MKQITLICNTRHWTLLRLALPMLAICACAGCGLAGTAVATGAGAAADPFGGGKSVSFQYRFHDSGRVASVLDGSRNLARNPCSQAASSGPLFGGGQARQWPIAGPHLSVSESHRE